MPDITPLAPIRTFLEAPTAPATALALTTILQGVVAAPTKLGAEYMPDTLVFDYIGVSDQSGFTIPAYNFSRKGEIPYFGNSPLIDGASAQLAGNLVSTGTPARTLIGSFPIAAGTMVLNQKFRLGINLTAQFSNAMPSTFLIQFDLADGTAMDGGLLIELGDRRLQNLDLEIELILDTGGGSTLILSTSAVGGLFSSGDVGVAKTAAMLGKVAEASDLTQLPTVVSAANAANALKIYLTDIGATATHTAFAAGRATFSAL